MLIYKITITHLEGLAFIVQLGQFTKCFFSIEGYTYKSVHYFVLVLFFIVISLYQEVLEVQFLHVAIISTLIIHI